MSHLNPNKTWSENQRIQKEEAEEVQLLGQ